MSNLAVAALILGGAMAIVHAPCLFAPERAKIWMTAFPRNKWAGWLLTAIALGWSVWLVMQIPLGRFDSYKPLLYGIGPIVFALIVLLMDELLAARALGGLFLIVPAPLLDAAPPHESDWRLVVTVLAYGFVIVGIALVLCPYMFRKTVAVWSRSPATCRVWGGAGMILGLIVIALALTVY
jgi:hypothetical protein